MSPIPVTVLGKVTVPFKALLLKAPPPILFKWAGKFIVSIVWLSANAFPGRDVVFRSSDKSNSFNLGILFRMSKSVEFRVAPLDVVIFSFTVFAFSSSERIVDSEPDCVTSLVNSCENKDVPELNNNNVIKNRCFRVKKMFFIVLWI